ncbi:hypothetical protein T484DRAFT_1741533 [Baffinella frigidus]|nr:hypothetical protein T484DRAFT_1741533 [Cryptophyta sp. CCMP2293]
MPVRDIEAIWALQNSTENELRMEGILVKRGDRWLRRWEKRRFVLAFGVLSYFPRKSGGEPRAQMELGEDTFVREALRADRGNCFEVGNGDRVWMMQGETADDVKRWTAAILRETKVEHGVAQTTGDDDAMPSRLDVTVPLEDAMTSCHDPSAAEQPHDSCAASSGEGGAGGASSGGGEGADAADEKTDGETDEKTEEDENTGGFQVVTEPLTAKNLAAFFKPRPRKAAAGDGSSAQAEDADIADGKTDVETDGFQVVTKPLTKADVSSFFKPRSRPPIEDATVHVASSAEAVASSPVVGEDVISSSQAGGEDLPSLCKAADDSENAGDTQEGLQKGEALWAGGEGGEGSVGGEEECQEGSGKRNRPGFTRKRENRPTRKRKIALANSRFTLDSAGAIWFINRRERRGGR